MKMRTLVLLTAAASQLLLTAGCELIVDFDRSDIHVDSSMMSADTGMPDTGTSDACTTCVDSGTDSGDNDSGAMDAMVDSAVDSGSDAEIDAAMDAAMDADDDDSGL